LSNNFEDLARLAATANEAHSRAQTYFEKGVAQAIEAGEALIAAKTQVAHGVWGAWLARNFSASAKTAQTYMRLARRLPELDDEKRNAVAEMSIRNAIVAVEEPRRISKKHEKLPPSTSTIKPLDSEPIPSTANFRPGAIASSGPPCLEAVPSAPAAKRVGGRQLQSRKPALHSVSGTWTAPQLMLFSRSRSPVEAMREIAEYPGFTIADLNRLERWLRDVADELGRLVHLPRSRT
jgi:hypothetical protein